MRDRRRCLGLLRNIGIVALLSSGCSAPNEETAVIPQLAPEAAKVEIPVVPPNSESPPPDLPEPPQENSPPTAQQPTAPLPPPRKTAPLFSSRRTPLHRTQRRSEESNSYLTHPTIPSRRAKRSKAGTTD
jgi:hypothetical protein